MRRALGGVLAAALLSACTTLGPADRAPRTDPIGRLSADGPSPWKVDFGDPGLAELLRTADAGALDIKIAVARLARARSEVEAARAARKPHVEVGAEAAAGGTSFRDARSAGTPSLEATYEVDLWGRLKRAQDAASHDQAAAAADIAAVRLLTAADTVRAYAALRDAEEVGARSDQRVQLAQRGLALTERRTAEGVVGPDAMSAARLAVARAAAVRQAAQEDVTLQQARLGDLTGQPGLRIPTGPQVVARDDPAATRSDAVAARPDVQAALARLQAADARRAEAVAASLPQFQIAALLGAPDAAIATLLDARALAWALAASISHQLIDGGAARARVHGASAEADVADLLYRKAVLQAWSEVRAAVVERSRAQRDIEAAQAALDQAQRALAANEVRRREGAADGLDDVAARSAADTALDQVRTARLSLTEARVRLALATGGQ